MRRAAMILAVLGCLAAASIAWASDQTITATPPNRYANTDITIDQGDHVTFNNQDTVDHDVTARDKGSDDKPLFGSDLAGTRESKPVKGTEYLTTGSYAFVCSVHPQMTGTLHVTSAGTTVPRPGGGGGTGGPGPTGGGADSTAPKVTLRLLDKKLSPVRRRRALRLTVTSNEAATVKLTARAGRTAIATGTATLTGAGAKQVRLALNAAGRRLAKRSRHLRVALSARASDASGNASSAQLTKKL
jgi:plastocyanin